MRKILYLTCLIFLVCFFTASSYLKAMNPQLLTPSTFKYDPDKMLVGIDVFNEGWSYNPGDTLFFTPLLSSGVSDVIFVVLSSTMRDAVAGANGVYKPYGNVYRLIIGKGGWLTSLAYSVDNSSILNDYRSAGLPKPRAGDIKYAPKSGTTYWVRFTDKPLQLSFGIGTVAGQNVVHTWDIPNRTVPTPRYFGFGGLRSPVKIEKISIIRASAEKKLTEAQASAARALVAAKAIDVIVRNAINAAMAQTGIGNQIAALNSIVTNPTYATATVSVTTQNVFTTAIMNVGGNYIYTNLNALNVLYSQIQSKTKLYFVDKINIGNTINPYLNSIGGNLVNFQTLLTNALKTKLLAGSVGKTGTNMYFINTVLIPAINKLIYLNQQYSLIPAPVLF